jgi:hypothetical protein
MLFVFLFVACHNNSLKQDNIGQIILEWSDKQIVLPDKMISFLSVTDSIVFHEKKLNDSKYKVLLFVDSIGCVQCRLNLFAWKNLIKNAEKECEDKICFLFFFHPKNKIQLRNILYNNEFSYPVFIDETNEIDRLNHFPKEPQYQCFLLDKDNRVLAIGNPVQNPKVWELYKKVMSD